mmetsp:Transcript_16620/g.43514  ORF Transcript_16620/g.43514 Transcript_16620/m.43514 type:complete len:204 (+) Transcript_16620:222-833(+)
MYRGTTQRTWLVPRECGRRAASSLRAGRASHPRRVSRPTRRLWCCSCRKRCPGPSLPTAYQRTGGEAGVHVPKPAPSALVARPGPSLPRGGRQAFASSPTASPPASARRMGLASHGEGLAPRREPQSRKPAASVPSPRSAVPRRRPAVTRGWTVRPSPRPYVSPAPTAAHAAPSLPGSGFEIVLVAKNIHVAAVQTWRCRSGA